MAQRNERGAQVVFTTLPDGAAARELVRRLVKMRIVACGTVLDGVRSIYRWEGDIEEEQEALVMLKTTHDRWPDLVAAVEALHPYEVPELLAVPVDHGLPRYVKWLVDETDTSRTTEAPRESE